MQLSIAYRLATIVHQFRNQCKGYAYFFVGICTVVLDPGGEFRLNTWVCGYIVEKWLEDTGVSVIAHFCTNTANVCVAFMQRLV